MQQGAGLANVGAATSAGTYILMDKGTNAGAADGKVKVELGDDPQRTGEYSFGFTINNLKDIATSFNLSADFFTQDVFTNQFEDGSEVNFEDTYTTDLSSNVTWTVDGQVVEMTAPAGLANCDFNGDGKVTKADGQALLDYVTGVLDSISNKDNADFDNDGNIDTYDAYLFFKQLSKCTVEIPANGSVHVEVNAKVLGLDKYDKASDNTGTYVEGYVYANELASNEGVMGDSHSIPVLGYYGSWTDPSMFDIGSYLEYHEAGTESRVPYMYAYNKNATKYQALTVQYAGDSGMYYFGGNPYVDETYDPNRAAINPDTTVFARANFSLIRNAADARVTITGENGNVYYDKAVSYTHLVTYYVGKLTVGSKAGVKVQTADYYTMSDFSSWGVPGSLELKPEITAPGGNIYSLQNGGGYQNMSGTSMASPQVAGIDVYKRQQLSRSDQPASALWPDQHRRQRHLQDRSGDHCHSRHRHRDGRQRAGLQRRPEECHPLQVPDGCAQPRLCGLRGSDGADSARLHPGLRRQQHRQCLHRLREPAEHLRGRRLPVLQERGRRPVR